MDMDSYFKEFLNNFKPYKGHWCYEDGVILKGAADLYEATGNELYWNFIERYLEEFVDEQGSLLGYTASEYNIDHVNAGKVLYLAVEKTGKEEFRIALEHQREQLRSHPRIPAGNFWHKNRYPHQVWLDGLYMALPFLAEYENKYNGHSGYDDIHRQFMTVKKVLKDPKTGLYLHAYDDSKSQFWADSQTGLSKHCWLRAEGWLLMALVDSIDKMSETIFEYYKDLVDMFKDAINAFLPYQDEKTGLWRQVVDVQGRDEENYLEVSGTAMVAYALLKGARLGILDDHHKLAGEKALQGIRSEYGYQDEAGFHIGGICEVAGLGVFDGIKRDGSFEYYISERVVPDEAKGIGPLMMAYAEYLKLGGQDVQF